MCPPPQLVLLPERTVLKADIKTLVSLVEEQKGEQKPACQCLWQNDTRFRLPRGVWITERVVALPGLQKLCCQCYNHSNTSGLQYIKWRSSKVRHKAGDAFCLFTSEALLILFYVCPSIILVMYTDTVLLLLAYPYANKLHIHVCIVNTSSHCPRI